MMSSTENDGEVRLLSPESRHSELSSLDSAKVQPVSHNLSSVAASDHLFPSSENNGSGELEENPQGGRGHGNTNTRSNRPPRGQVRRGRCRSRPIDRSEAISRYIRVLVEGVTQPVVTTMIFTVALVLLLQFQSPSLIQTPAHEESSRFVDSIEDALLLVGGMAVMTTVVLFCVRAHLDVVVWVWMGLTSFITLGLVAAVIVWKLICKFNVAIDFISFVLVFWNVGVVATFALMIAAPEKVKQKLLVGLSFTVAVFSTLVIPEWMIWSFLVALVVWDMLAVLTPCGPLRLLLEHSAERERPIPMYSYDIVSQGEREVKDLYLSGMFKSWRERGVAAEAVQQRERREGGENSSDETSGNYTGVAIDAHGGETNEDDEGNILNNSSRSAEQRVLVGGRTGSAERNNSSQTSRAQRNQTRNMIGMTSEMSLGLGDFIFYSVLAARASLLSIECGYTSSVAIILGLLVTMGTVPFTGTSILPALPVSITLGIMVNFAIYYVVLPQVLT